MNNNSKAIITFCSHLCTGNDVRPLTAVEWSRLATIMLEIGVLPENLLSFQTKDFEEILGVSTDDSQRMSRLLERSPSLAFDVVDYEAKGIQIVTRADDAYPKALKTKLKNNCPPLFYCAGNLKLLQNRTIGYVGSRKITPEDAKFAAELVKKTVNNGFGVVSGGADGVDSIASDTALNNGGFVVEFLGESMLKRMKNPLRLNAIQNGQLMLMSFVVPDAGFSAGNLMARNKFIYAHSDGTVIIRSEKKGGTWSGANENLRQKWCPSFCWNKQEYDGNQELIKLGAQPIDETWNGYPMLGKSSHIGKDSIEESPKPTEQQMMLPEFE